MKIRAIITIAAAVGFLAACDDKEECTQEIITAKSTELITKIQGMATSDPAKVAELAPKIQEIATKAEAAGADDLQASCDALDEIMAELNK